MKPKAPKAPKAPKGPKAPKAVKKGPTAESVMDTLQEGMSAVQEGISAVSEHYEAAAEGIEAIGIILFTRSTRFIYVCPCAAQDPNWQSEAVQHMQHVMNEDDEAASFSGAAEANVYYKDVSTSTVYNSLANYMAIAYHTFNFFHRCHSEGHFESTREPRPWTA